MPAERREFKDYFSGHAAEYARYRPGYPDQLFSAISDLLPSPLLALDCATGSGQLALGLVDFCERIIAMDASPGQVARAPAHSRIEYRVGPAEDTGLVGIIDMRPFVD